MKFLNIFFLVLCFSVLISSFVSADFSFEDLTYSHSMRCCNSTHCADLYILNNTFAYTDLNPFYCYELGGFSKLNYVDILIQNFPLILFVLIIFMFIILILKRGKKEFNEE